MINMLLIFSGVFLFWLLTEMATFRKHNYVYFFKNKVEINQDKWGLILAFAALSNNKKISKHVDLLNPYNRKLCLECERHKKTNQDIYTESGTLSFLGFEWGWYERLDCYCGDNLIFAIIKQ